MGNKLRDVFTTNQPAISEQFTFRDIEAQNRFAEAIKKVQEKGESAFVGDGVSAKTCMKSGDESLIINEGNIEKLAVFPNEEPFPVEIEIDNIKRTIACRLIGINSGAIVKAPKDSIIDFKVKFDKDEKTLNLTVTPQLKIAKNSADVVDAYKVAMAVFRVLVNANESLADEEEKHGQMLTGFIERMKYEQRLFEIADLIEKNLYVKFDISKFGQDENYVRDLEELYFSLIKGFPIRLNAKLNPSEASGVNLLRPDNEITIGSSLEITSRGNITYNICDLEISLFTSNMVLNAVVKDKVQEEDGRIKLIFGNDEINPMFLSYKVFMSEAEVQKEIEVMISHKEEYAAAKTVTGYLNSEGIF